MFEAFDLGGAAGDLKGQFIVSDDNYMEIAAEIVVAYVANNTVAAGDLPALIEDVHRALHQIAENKITPAPKETKFMPAVPIKKSITPDFIISLEDGRKFKSLKRHLAATYNMTPVEYRAKWSLPDDYPMVAPNYAATRSALAKNMGLGQAARKRGARLKK
jgi:predicted transcriptional regulator